MKQRELAIFALALAIASFAAHAPAAEGETQVATGATIAVGAPTAGPQIASDEPWMLILMKIDGGIAVIPRETTGAYGRLSAEGMLMKDPERAGLVWGFWDAFEGWGSNDGGGFAFPIVFYAGYRNEPLVATLGGGLNLITIDNLDHDAGFNLLFSPRGEARLGIQTGPVLIAATGGVQYHWLWGRADITMFQAGLTLGFGQHVQEPATPPPRR